MSEPIQITANSQAFQIEADSTLTDFLAQHEYQVDQVVCEKNGEALSPSELEKTRLQDGDQLEIVRIVAGG